MGGGRSGSRQLLCGLAIVAALGAVLAVGGGGAPVAALDAGSDDANASRGSEAALDPEQLARISRAVTPTVARRVERLRGLEFDRVPEPEVVSSEFLNRLGERDARRAQSARGLAADEAAARILGLLAAGEQLEAILGSTGDLAAAAYDTERERLYVVEDAVVANRALIEFLLAHELTHALEDQRFGLPEPTKISDDGVLAQLALIEGTATELMVQYAGAYLGPLDLLGATQGLDPSTGEVPRFVVDQLLWAYLAGGRFVNELRELAGGGWKLVDHALSSRPPQTTEQILHPDLYLTGEDAPPVAVAGGKLRARGWRPAGGGVLGELVSFHLLRLGGDPAVARRGARGWNGDRYELWRRERPPGGCRHPCRDRFVLVVRWRWDTSADVGEFLAAVPAFVEVGLGGEPTDSDSWNLDGGSVVVGADPAARESTLVFAPDEATAGAVAADQRTTTAGKGRPDGGKQSLRD